MASINTSWLTYALVCLLVIVTTQTTNAQSFRSAAAETGLRKSQSTTDASVVRDVSPEFGASIRNRIDFDGASVGHQPGKTQQEISDRHPRGFEAIAARRLYDRESLKSIDGQGRRRRDLNHVAEWNHHPGLLYSAVIIPRAMRTQPLQSAEHLHATSFLRKSAGDENKRSGNTPRRRQQARCPGDDVDSDQGDQPDIVHSLMTRNNVRDGRPISSSRLQGFGGCNQHRRSSSTSLTTWSKRPRLRYYRDGEGPKRNWRTNMMRVWGKRAQNFIIGS